MIEDYQNFYFIFILFFIQGGQTPHLDVIVGTIKTLIHIDLYVYRAATRHPTWHNVSCDWMIARVKPVSLGISTYSFHICPRRPNTPLGYHSSILKTICRPWCALGGGRTKPNWYTFSCGCKSGLWITCLKPVDLDVHWAATRHPTRRSISCGCTT